MKKYEVRGKKRKNRIKQNIPNVRGHNQYKLGTGTGQKKLASTTSE
jgi:hypothetical protein